MTTPAKQYPVRLCAFLASHVYQFCLGAGASIDPYGWPKDVEENVAGFFTPLDVYSAAHRWGEIGRDFVGYGSAVLVGRALDWVG
eukprot:8736488-Pyramimonas_sp.AAC.1